MFNQQISSGTDGLSRNRSARESQPYGPSENRSHLRDPGTLPLRQSTVVPVWVGDRPRVADLADDSRIAGAASEVPEHGWNIVTHSDSRKRSQIYQKVISKDSRRNQTQRVKPISDYCRTCKPPTIQILGSDQLHPSAQPENQIVHLRTRLRSSSTNRA